jgi:hypothetical protein
MEDEESSMFLRNVCIYLPNYTMSHVRKLTEKVTLPSCGRKAPNSNLVWDTLSRLLVSVVAIVTSGKCRDIASNGLRSIFSILFTNNEFDYLNS